MKYVVTERGNGLPDIGDEVIRADPSGWHQLLMITARGRIQTAQWQANRMCVECEVSDRNWNNLTEAEQAEAWANLHHINENVKRGE